MYFTFNYYIRWDIFVNNVMCGWNMFLVLLTNGSSSIHLEWSKEKVDIHKSITYIRKKKKIQDLNNIKKKM